ncbi:zinc metalloprotease HtpX [Aerosakkonema funiforme]|uniref:M48 family metalloprotease n=2 Tax=Oscillatoriophycideae TaxID=1301283 RepID=A0A926VG95_9CYAN|nr:zinc metalloprotease HtpX [Aerosakkonema funiforme]MBD2183163.1 M48 family metalloprotease [Aerosakkonema funiforme FACHB-1375]
MVFPPDPPASGASASGKENSSLEAGLAALKQGNYKDAIAHLEAVCQIQQNQNAIYKAQMGLVVAYERSGNVLGAIALCKTLSKSSSRPVKEWADRTLADFVKRYPEEGTARQEGSGEDNQTSQSKDTGFVPFNPTAQVSSSRPKVPVSPPSSSLKDRNSSLSSPSSPSKQGNKENQPEIRSQISQKFDSASSPGFVPLDKATKPSRGAEEKVASRQSSDPEKKKAEKSLDYKPGWKQAGRAQKWQRLPVKTGFLFDLSQLWGVQAVTAIVLLISTFWAIDTILKFAVKTGRDLLIKLRIIYIGEDYYNDPMRLVPIASAIALIALIAASPWLMDGLLKAYHNLKPLPTATLSERSPEAVRVLQRFTREQRLPSPTLFVLPNSAPLALTYGNLRRTARIVVTQGLLDRLADDEIATIYAEQLGHIVYWDFALMSLGVLVAQVPYTFYWRVSQLGDLSPNSFLRLIAGAIAALSYGIYWLFRWPLLWLSRARIYYSDRISCEVTGNPNGLSRAILKMAIGIAKDIEQQGQTSNLLESFELLTTVGYRQAMSLGSLYAHTPLEPLLAWDCVNPHRRWLAINNSHPPMGERLQILARYANFWKLETELNLTYQSSVTLQNSKFFLQGSPYFGVFMGLALGGIFWFIGGISSLMRFRPLDWMWGDPSIIYGCLLIGISIGILLRIDSFFPDMKPLSVKKEAVLADLLTNPVALPADSQPIYLEGKLLGRPGVSNWLCQDLILQTATGLVKLHFFSWFGPIGNLLPRSPRPSDLVNRPISATGWFRRGVTPWIDLDSLRTQGGKTSQSAHPVWSTILAIAAALWGAYIIFKGGA